MRTAVVDHAVIDVLIVDGEKFLLVQEGRPERGGRYNLPGGHIEPHETLLEAALREAKEETGFDIELTGFVGIYQSIYEDLNVSGPVLSAKIIGGHITVSKEHLDSIWVTQDELIRMANSGKLFTMHPVLAVNHYLTRGSLPLDVISCKKVVAE